jgi:hypothetical protein
VPTSDSPGFTASSSLSLQVATTQDVKLEELVSEPTFLSNLESSIAVGLEVIVEQVLVTKVEVGSRRLQAGLEGLPTRRLQNAALKVEYEVYMNGEAETARILDSMKGPMFEPFQNEIQAKEKASGRSVVVDSITVDSLSSEPRTESIGAAKAAAKEKAMPTTTTSAPTTEKPVIVSATEAPSTTTAEALDGEPAAGGVCSLIPSVWLLALAIIATWH